MTCSSYRWTKMHVITLEEAWISLQGCEQLTVNGLLSVSEPNSQQGDLVSKKKPQQQSVRARYKL